MVTLQSFKYSEGNDITIWSLSYDVQLGLRYRPEMTQSGPLFFDGILTEQETQQILGCVPQLQSNQNPLLGVAPHAGERYYNTTECLAFQYGQNLKIYISLDSVASTKDSGIAGLQNIMNSIRQRLHAMMLQHHSK